MSDWAVHLVTAGSLPMRDGLMAPRGELGDIEVVSNVLLLEGSGGTVLVDTAAGGLDDRWEGARSNLAEALAPHCRVEDVDAVVLTHLDFDHCGGAPDVPAERVFVTATAAAWARALPPDRSARRVLEALGDRLQEAADGDEVAPGIRMVEAPGHRGGHACVEIAVDGPRRAVFLADVIHHPSHVEHPEWDREFDTDPETGLATRRRWLAELAGTGVWCAASHIDGWGTIEAAGDGYRWQPAG